MTINSVSTPRHPSQHPWRLSWVLSLVLHGTVISLLALSITLAPVPNETSSPTIQLDGRWVAPSNTQERWSDVMISSRDQPSLPDPATNDLSSFVQRQIAQSIEDANLRTEAENEEKLLRLSRRLSETSNRENIDGMAQFLGGLIAPRNQAASPQGAVRPFDVNTAQIDRVRKEVDSLGQVHYIATLVDAQGVTTDSELDPESGAQLYKTMKIIESNPLLESVYRKVVMGFLDQILSKPTWE